MITLEDIKEFFKIEDEDSENKNREFEKLNLEEQIQEGKAIKDLMLDGEYREEIDGDNIRLLHCNENLSEFKIGDTVILCTEKGKSNLCECHIYDFIENGDIKISINSYNFSSSIDEHIKEKLILIKAKVSMYSFFWNFCTQPAFRDEKFFENHIINTIPQIELDGKFIETKQQNKEVIKEHLDIDLNETQLDAITKAELSKNYFLIQGPPGTGKSFLLAMHILDCILGKKKVIVVAPTHMAVNNLLIKVIEVAYNVYGTQIIEKLISDGIILKCGQSHNAKNLSIRLVEKTYQIKNKQYLNISSFNNWDEQWQDQNGNNIEAPLGFVIGMTPYSLQSRRASGLKYDELVIDEAGQMTIPIALMSLVKYDKIILAGDHKQLPPIISQNLQNKELNKSIFEHLIRPYNSTMLNVSFRMNGEICDLVSDLFYEGKLKSYNRSQRLRIHSTEPLFAANNPIVFVDCQEEGKKTSNNEAKKAIEIVIKYIELGIKAEDMAILAPFRAQCALIRKLLMKYLTKEQRDSLVVDTVDRMQGQEREIILYSFTSGNVEYMNQMSDFLFNPNKLNVAFSRAKNKLILLGNVGNMKVIHNKLLDEMFSHKAIQIL